MFLGKTNLIQFVKQEIESYGIKCSAEVSLDNINLHFLTKFYRNTRIYICVIKTTFMKIDEKKIFPNM